MVCITPPSVPLLLLLFIGCIRLVMCNRVVICVQVVISSTSTALKYNTTCAVLFSLLTFFAVSIFSSHFIFSFKSLLFILIHLFAFYLKYELQNETTTTFNTVLFFFEVITLSVSFVCICKQKCKHISVIVHANL